MKTQTQAAQTAKLIRKELKENFPSIKFSVTSETYSMGDSVNISYTDGVKYESVDSIVSKYQYGSFNAMEDIYENTNTKDMPQVKFVQIRRMLSQEAKAKRVKELIEENGRHMSRIGDFINYNELPAYEKEDKACEFLRGENINS